MSDSKDRRTMYRARLNKGMFIGNLASDPVLRRTQKGSSVVNVRLITNNGFTVQATGERKEEAIGIPLVLWHTRAESFQSKCKKGAMVFAEGHFQLNTRTIEGRKVSTMELVVDGWQILDSISEEDYYEDSNENVDNEDVDTNLIPE